MEKAQNMEISRNVILDLLPLYVANEVSEDTRSLFEHYLEADPELSNVAKQLASSIWTPSNLASSIMILAIAFDPVVIKGAKCLRK